MLSIRIKSMLNGYMRKVSTTELFMQDIIKVDKPDGSFFYAVSLEVPDAIYLVKVDVKIDDYEDAENGLFGGGGDIDADDPDDFPDDDTSSSFSEEEESDE